MKCSRTQALSSSACQRLGVALNLIVQDGAKQHVVGRDNERHKGHASAIHTQRFLGAVMGHFYFYIIGPNLVTWLYLAIEGLGNIFILGSLMPT